MCFVAFVSSIYYYTKTNAKLFNYHEMISENSDQKKQLVKFDEETRKLNVAIQDLKEKDQEVRGLLGIEDLSFSRPSKEASKKKYLNNMFRDKIVSLSVNDLRGKLYALNKDLVQSKQSYNLLLASVKDMTQKFDFTPSISPISGPIIAGFGWRRHPIFGSMEFHRGVDIPSFTGANILSSAKGKVVYSGWYSGYGNAVIVEHRDGISTVYGHASRLLVNVGEIVNKGQIIARVGSTGLSTGPHLHYEVRKWNQAINPTKYLDLNIFTANKDIR
ncbi:MAG: hypothetical protein A2X42_03210 [Candidatus Margulisbacteria bacterium GWF2_38_17]|nr:MAG: hypothetical protein A2X42_03210 [Candidatus Margulisbacteria bacterium GWF2_38_17]OGI09929.1 MAG: hypothetical protein A2X41_05955 [Candidatus Margulisbacteria bacterium GWE2_39_32]